MRKIATLTLPILLASFTAALAQPPSKGADQATKLVAQANYTATQSAGALKLVDSFALRYAPGRGSAFDANTNTYYLTGGNFSADMYDAEMVSTNVIQAFPAPLVAFDTLLYFNSAASVATGHVDAMETANYNADDTYNTIAYGSSASTSGFKNNSRQALLYNSGLLSAVYLLKQTATGTDTTVRRFLSRDAADRIITDSTVQYRIVSGVAAFDNAIIRRFTYNAGGQYISGTEDYASTPPTITPGNSFTLSYHADGRLHTYRSASQDMSYTDTITYTPLVTGYTGVARTMYDASGNPTGERYNYSCHINAANLKDSAIQMFIYGSDTSYSIQATVYTVGGLPAIVTTYSRYSTGVRIDGRTYYYYSKDSVVDVGEPLSISPVKAGQSSIMIAPNPTTGNFALHYTQPVPTAALQLFVTNMSGQLVHAERFIPQGTTTSVTLGAEAAPGMYNIAVYSAGGAAYYKGMLMKQ